MTEPTSTTDGEQHASQLVPPRLDSRISAGPIAAVELIYFVPAVVVVAAGWLLGGGVLSVTLLVTGGVLALGTLTLVAAADETTTPADIVRAQATGAYLSRVHPLSDTDAEGVHGVAEIYNDGTARMADERVVGAVRIDGPDMDYADHDRRQELRAQFAAGVDADLHPTDVECRLWSTTRDESLGEVDTFADLAEDERFGGERWRPVRELCASIAEWSRDTDRDEWDARHWQHFIVVESHPDDVDLPEHKQPTGVQEQLRDRLNVGDVDDDPRVSAQREQVRDAIDVVETRVCGRIDDCAGDSVGPAGVATLLRGYWTGQSDAVTTDDALDTDALDAQCAPAGLDARDGQVRLGDDLARTLWVADYPTEPDACALRDVVTMQGVDVDVAIRLRPREKQDRMYELQHEIAEADAEALERESDTDPAALDADDAVEALIRQYQTARDSTGKPWRVAMYVTIRADTDRALREATDRLESGMADVDGSGFAVGLQQQTALRNDVQSVADALAASPAELTTKAPRGRQLQLFRSASPLGRDAFDGASVADRYRDVLGGTVGALCPFVGVDLQESDGIRYGRSLQNGSRVSIDPFDRGGAPHQLTIGKSGGGKTHAVKYRALRWWLQEDDRTLILCDTKGEFEDVTTLLNGEHIVVDGQQTINPLEIQAGVADIAAETDVDPHRIKVDEAREFLAGILRGQGVDPGRYVATIEEALESTYYDAGIHRDEPESFGRDSPTMVDFLDTLDRIADSPGDFSYGSGAEAETKGDLASELLTKLSGFRDGGKYESLVGESTAAIRPGGVSYLDLRQVGVEGAEKSTMLSLMLGQVGQAIKQTPGQTMFVADEAHYLLHSPEMVKWLQRAARQWRALDASMWLVSQSPQDFVGVGDGPADAHRETITGQCSTIEFFRTESLTDDTAERFGMNERQAEFVRNQATGGEAGLGFSQSLVSVSDRDGWVRLQIETSPGENDVLGGDAG